IGTTSYSKTMLSVEGHGRHAQLERVLDGSDPDSLSIFYVHGDHLGSGHILTGASGDLLSQEEYLPYGGSSDRRDARNRYRFIGVERDEDTGLCMTGPRTFDPVTGRFLQGDPLLRPEVSPYAYASGRPTSRVDVDGYSEQVADAVMCSPGTISGQAPSPEPVWNAFRGPIDDLLQQQG